MNGKRPLAMDDIRDRIPEYQEIFAKHLCRGIQPFAAALAIFGQENVGLAYQCGQEWPCDANVIRIQESLTGVNPTHNIISKEELAAKILKATDNHFVFEDKLKGYKLYADILGYIDRGGAVVNNNIIDNRRVMVVKDHGTPEEWERKVTAQQRRLIDVSTNTAQSERALEAD